MREAAAFIIEEGVSLPAQELRRDRAAHGGAETVSMCGGKRRRLAVDQNVVVPPKVGSAHIAAEIILVQRAVNIIRSALGGHLNLAAGSVVELRGLVAGADPELFDALNWRRNYSGSRAARRAASSLAIPVSICGLTPSH